MAKAENKTKATSVSPESFIQTVEHDVRRADAKVLLDLFADVTQLVPRMWGPSIIGYGRYHYKYESGREGEFMMTGFSPRKANQVIYIMPGYTDHSAILDRIGKYKIGKSCLYINKLADIDLDVLRELITAGFEDMKSRYPDWKLE
ncbi:DUF1801 domain-containing protein [Ponticaulis sp.]|uniref:DUF1801 domain-containing protein n=1 Tax=Ponticaulis sp. TaxID=2020902 RepID=UPI000C586F3E|nr:DUF1801 domain-containing protein [Ponticaulis sp.]MAJ08496.1 hypothetical protein [Ponticaulis sp.]HBH91433.1 hypothetical protein [Hyphomonadaceae bacterium]HBJ91577.1 hypothetical protein [Hyphomonadaceae bacterium]|tara:strand:- start:2577 stop:3014 length:438 start_codon:yes stop_codon:yes gene_type:complete